MDLFPSKKSRVFDTFKEFKALVENQTEENKCHTMKTNGGGIL